MIPAAVTSEAEQILFGGLMLFEVAIIGKEEYKYLVLLFIRNWFYIYRAYVLVFLISKVSTYISFKILKLHLYTIAYLFHNYCCCYYSSFATNFARIAKLKVSFQSKPVCFDSNQCW